MVTSVEGTVKINERVHDYIEQLAAEIYFSPNRDKPKVLTVASAEGREGRSSIALALAIQVRLTLSESVVMIEANLRSPSVGKLIGLSREHAGLADLLSGTNNVDSAITSVGKELPDVLPAGNVDGIRISNLINREKWNNLISELKKRYEYLIIETPAINRFPEGQIITGLSDATVIVINAGTTSRESVALAMKKIESAGGHLSGVVLNRKQFHLPNWLYRRL